MPHGRYSEVGRLGETMNDAYIGDAVRTPTGRTGGGLAEGHPADMGAHVIRSL